MSIDSRKRSRRLLTICVRVLDDDGLTSGPPIVTPTPPEIDCARSQMVKSRAVASEDDDLALAEAVADGTRKRVSSSPNTADGNSGGKNGRCEATAGSSYSSSTSPSVP